MKNPIVTFLDTETSPLVMYAWQAYEANALKVLQASQIISVSWKQLGAKETNVKALCDYEEYTPGVVDDKALVSEIWSILDSSDIVSAHNGAKFDLPVINARFVYHDLPPPSHYQVIDTLKIAKKYFRFTANSLNALGQYLNVGSKVNNGGFDLWVRCMAGDKEAWKLMKLYNKQDTILLEKVYLKLRPYFSGHPDVNLLSGDTDVFACHTCGSHDTTKRGFSYTKTGRKQRFQCTACGSWSVGPFKKTSANEQQVLEED